MDSEPTSSIIHRDVSDYNDRPALLADIAERACVSTATVSRVLNNSGPVSQKLRQRVLAAVEELNYSRNAIAGSLAGKRTQTIGLIVTDVLNPFHTALARGVEDAAQRHGFNVILCNSNEDPRRESVYLDVLWQRRVDGIIFVPSGHNNDRLARLRRIGVPLVQIDRCVADLETDAAVIDNVAGAAAAVRHLVQLGYRRIGTIALPQEANTGRDRLQGYRQALAECGEALDPDLVVESDYKPRGGLAAAQRLLLLPNPPRALFIASAPAAFGAFRALAQHRLRIGRDIAMVVFDDTECFGLMSPSISAVAQPTYTLGGKAVGLLLRRLSEPGAPIKKSILPARLIVRESSGMSSGRAPDPNLGNGTSAPHVRGPDT